MRQANKPSEFDSTVIERDPGLQLQICEYPVNQRDESISRSALVDEGLNNWKKVNDGSKCVFLLHVGLASSSHSYYVISHNNLKKSSQHIEKVLNAQSKEEILKNRMRVKATIETIQVLAPRGLGFRGHDESLTSLNQGNLIELLKFKARGNDALESIILKNAPQNAKYTSLKIQKEILHILANRVRNMIFDEVAGGYFCILVDESQDESEKEQMALILRYVKNDGFLGKWFFDIVGVKNISALTLKKEILNILSRFNLSIQNMRGQGYDDASNMRGKWNRLQALFLKHCPYTYYAHYFAHCLQLALITAAKDEPNVWQFFSHLSCIVNLVASSPKLLGGLKSFHRSEVENMLASGERQSSKGANQIGTLHRAGATRWSSHYDSVRNLIV
ncbi:zinc finger MYM-type protein 1-like [Camellia sinensis]|uniref:zinc finger MYM-type protein 1-like n=1 Tax=Camellia sinensis TaxID=4442 RepID=UPI0010355409|nr:zinc finger MYM-type protein 1-like [Camellia sinensis]